MEVRAVLFDLDCTLTDRKASVMAAAELLARRYALPEGCTAGRLAEVVWSADQWGYRDRTEFFDEIVETIGWREAPAMQELLRFWAEDHPGCGIMAAGARELLRDLRGQGIATAIITNGDARTQAAKIRHLRLAQMVDEVVISGELGIHKPDARIFDHTLGRLGLEASCAVFVGDHPVNDILGSQQAGMRAVWISGTMAYPAGQVKPWRTIGGVGELSGILLSGKAEHRLQASMA